MLSKPAIRMSTIFDRVRLARTLRASPMAMGIGASRILSDADRRQVAEYDLLARQAGAQNRFKAPALQGAPVSLRQISGCLIWLLG